MSLVLISSTKLLRLLLARCLAVTEYLMSWV